MFETLSREALSLGFLTVSSAPKHRLLRGLLAEVLFPSARISEKISGFGISAPFPPADSLVS